MTKMEPAAVDRVVRRRDNGQDGWVTRQIASETLIIPVASHVGNLDAIYTLNGVGARIWQLLETAVSVGAIVGTLADEFDVSADRAATDVVEFLAVLESRGLLHPDDSPQR